MTAVGTIARIHPGRAFPSAALHDQAERRELFARAWTLELAFVVLVALGLALVWSASSPMALERHESGTYFLWKQARWAALAVSAFWIASRLPMRAIELLAWVALPASVVALAALLIPGVADPHGGATRWVTLGGFSIQPAEPAKVALVMTLAAWLARLPAPSARTTLAVLAAAAVPAGLVYLEPDLGTAVILAASAFGLLFLAGAEPRHLLSVVAAAIPALAWSMIHEPYRVRRLIAFWHPWEYARTLGYQIVQSFVAFGSGGVLGRGLGGGTQKLFYLPESHTDFVFAVVGEEMGFVGVLSVTVLFLSLVLLGARVARASRDRFGFLLAAGLTALIGLTAAANMAVTMGLVPTKGLALPFLSYGGSALVSNAVALGLVLAVNRSALAPQVSRGGGS